MLLTIDANKVIEHIHDRTPVILKLEGYDMWLDPKVKYPNLLKPLLRPHPSEEMMVQPVSPKVNRTSYDVSDSIDILHLEEN